MGIRRYFIFPLLWLAYMSIVAVAIWSTKLVDAGWGGYALFSVLSFGAIFSLSAAVSSQRSRTFLLSKILSVVVVTLQVLVGLPLLMLTLALLLNPSGLAGWNLVIVETVSPIAGSLAFGALPIVFRSKVA
jgi:hypothetical protein